MDLNIYHIFIKIFILITCVFDFSVLCTTEYNKSSLENNVY